MDEINEIIDNLSEDDIEKLRNLAGDLFGGDSQPGPHNSPGPHGQSGPPTLPDMPDPAMMKKISKVMSSLKNSSGENSRVNFIASLKPLLSDKRQQKADEAMKMIHLLDILPALKDTGIF